MAQVNIEYGAFPNDANASTIRTAFEATQDNFTQLFGNLANLTSNVSSISAGDGISINGSTGNVNISANFNSLTVQSTSLSIGGLGGRANGNGYTINNSSSILTIELGTSPETELDNLTLIGNLKVNGNEILANVADVSIVQGNITLGSGNLYGRVQARGSVGAVQYRDSEGLIHGDSALTFDNGNLRTTGGIEALYLNAGLINSSTANLLQLAANSIVTNSTTTADLLATDAVFSNSVTANTFESNGISTLATLNVTENSTVDGEHTVIGNLTAGNISTAGMLSVTGNADFDIITANQGTFSSIDGTLSTSTQPYITSLGTLGSLVVDDSITANSITVTTVTTDLITGILATPVQSNIILLGTLSTLNVGGGATVGGTLAVGNLEVSSDSTFGNIEANNITTGNIVSQHLSVPGNSIMGNLTVDVISSTDLGLSGNITVAQNLEVSGYITGADLSLTDQLLANSLTSNTVVNAQTGNFSGQVVSNNIVIQNSIYAGGPVIAEALMINGNANVVGSMVVGNLTVSDSKFGDIDANTISTLYDATVTRDLYVFGNSTVQKLTSSGAIAGASATIAGNISAGNIQVTRNLNGFNSSLTGYVLANIIVSNTSITGQSGNFAEQIAGNNLVVHNNLYANGVVSASTLGSSVSGIETTFVLSTIGEVARLRQNGAFKFRGQTADPASPQGGDVYYNQNTGKLRLYNGVLEQWENLN